MDKETALKNLDDCFSFWDKIDTQKYCKALLLDDKDTIKTIKSRYDKIIGFKQSYIDKIKNAVDEDEVKKIICAVNLNELGNIS